MCDEHDCTHAAETETRNRVSEPCKITGEGHISCYVGQPTGGEALQASYQAIRVTGAGLITRYPHHA